jgi:hypothetical protein
MIGWTIVFRRGEGGLKPFFTYQLLLSGVLFAVLYWSSLGSEVAPNGDLIPSPALLMLGITDSNPRSLRNAALAFAMLAAANGVALASLMRRTGAAPAAGAVGAGAPANAVGNPIYSTTFLAISLNVLAMAHYLVEVVLFRTVRLSLGLGLELLAVLALGGFGLSIRRTVVKDA